MALITGTEVPPSLVTTLARSVTVYAGSDGTAGWAGKNQYMHWVKAPRYTGTVAEFAKIVGEWFRSNWTAVLAGTNLSAFYTARANDIRTKTFPPAYWSEGALLSDFTEKYTPSSVAPYTGEVAAQYYDTLRRPSYCPMARTPTVYATPAYPGNEAQPYPGWKGRVIDTLWRDLYFAVRRLRFSLPILVDKDSLHPVALVIESNVAAEATTRGNEAWYTVQAKPTFYGSDTYVPSLPKKVETSWTRILQPNITLPPMDPYGWSYAFGATYVRDCRVNGQWYTWNRNGRVQVRVWTPPSRGLFFSRNDQVEVLHRCTVRVFVARPGHG